MCKTGKAAVLTGINQDFEIREYPLTSPAEGTAMLKLCASGICGTDIHIHRGKLGIAPPAIIGHEFVGEVMDISAADSKASGISKGDHAIVDIACPCGECALCQSGDDANCLHLGVSNAGNPDMAPHFWGGYVEYNYSPVKNLIRIPKGLDPKLVCVYACAGPTALHAFQLARKANINLESADVAVVQGLGPVGTFAVLYLASLGIKNVIAITARDNPAREEYAKKLGATAVYSLDDTSAEEIAEKIKAINGYGADLVFEASGNPQAVAQGMDLLRNRGLYLIPGQYSNSGGVNIAPELITFKALQIMGSSQYSVRDVESYLDFLQKNPQHHSHILSATSEYKVEDINLAFEDAKAGRNIKTMLIGG